MDTRVTSAITQIQTEFSDGSRPVTGDVAHLLRLIVVDPSYPFNKPSVTCNELILTVLRDTNRDIRE